MDGIEEPTVAELQESLKDHRQLMVLLLRKMGGEATITPVEMDDTPSWWRVTQREEVDGSLRFTLTENRGKPFPTSGRAPGERSGEEG